MIKDKMEIYVAKEPWRMKMLSQVIVILMIFMPSSTQSNEIFYSPKEVYENVIQYLNVIFGSKEPTLLDYVKFEGMDPGYEALLTLQSCKKRFPDRDPEESEECGRYIAFRYNNMDKVKSLYFKMLREKLAITSSLIHSAEINVIVSPSLDEAYSVVVIFPLLDHRLKLSHVLHRDLAELGLIKIIEVDGISIEYFLSLQESMCHLAG